MSLITTTPIYGYGDQRDQYSYQDHVFDRCTISHAARNDGANDEAQRHHREIQSEFGSRSVQNLLH